MFRSRLTSVLQVDKMRDKRRRRCLLYLLTSALFVHTSTAYIECPVANQDDCECTEDSQGRVIINCRGKRHTALPAFKPSNDPFYELTLANNEIQTIGANSLSLNIERLDITGNPLKSVHDDAFNDVKDTLKQLLLHGSQGQVTPYPASAVSKLTLLEQLYLKYFDIPSLPENALATLTSLQILSLEQCGLTTLSDSDFYGPKNSIVSLDLSENGLTEIPSRALASLTTIESVYLNSNPITSLPASAFQGVTSLLRLDLSQNGLAIIDSNAFSGLENTLLELNMHSCQLDDQQTAALRNLANLQVLVLRDNSITNIPYSLLDNLDQLRELHFTRNDIHHLNRAIFSGPSPSLEILHLEEIPLSNIETDTFADFTALEELYLDKTPVTQLQDNSLDSMAPTLNKLSLRQTNLQPSHWSMLTRLTALQNLWLDGNDLQSIPDMAFQWFSRMKNLELSNNNINALTQWSLHGTQKSLTDLNLASNNLVSLSECTIHPDDYTSLGIFKLKLDENPLDCDCRLLWLHSWLIQYKEDILFQFVQWKCSDGRLFRMLDASELECSPPIEPVVCEDPPVLPETTPSSPLTVSINATTETSLHVVWQVAAISGIEHFAVTYKSLNSSNDTETLYFDHTIYQCLLPGLIPASSYWVCVDVVTSSRAANREVCVLGNTDPRTEPVIGSDNTQLQIILGSVLGAIAFIIIIVVIVLCIVFRSGNKEADVFGASLPQSGYNSKRFSKANRRSIEVADAMQRLDSRSREQDLQEKLDGFTYEERIRMLKLMTKSGGSTMSMASNASSHRYLPEPPPMRGKVFGAYLNPLDIKDDQFPPGSPTEKHMYEEIPADTYEQIPEDSFI